MTTFLQIHVLTSYPPSNLNRDDTGRPKTAMVGRRERLRISSQALKRAWRTSPEFMTAIKDARGVRTKRLGQELLGYAESRIKDEKKRRKLVKAVAGAFGAMDTDTEAKTLVFLSGEERAAARALVDEAAESGKEPDAAALEQLVMTRPRAADIAMFGRMLADAPRGNVDAAVQVAHAITVHEASVEDDYFSAVDDLQDQTKQNETGASHIGETGFGAGVFYIYLCVNLDLLVENLGGDNGARALARDSLDGLLRAVLTVAPSGKQASFASRARASYCLAELGSSQPRSLSVAFLAPITDSSPSSRDGARSVLANAVTAIRATRDDFANMYDDASASSYELAAGHATGTGTQGTEQELLAFATNPLRVGRRA